MLLQVHYVQDGRHELIAQADLTDWDDYHTWINDVRERHPLPQGAEFLVCNQDADCFFVSATRPDGTIIMGRRDQFDHVKI